MTRFLKGLFLIARPVNVLITMISIVVAASLAGSLRPFGNVVLACLSAGFIAAGANAINDYFDVEIDRINKPKRPIPSGLLSPLSAYGIAIASFLLGVALNLWLTVSMLVLALVVSVALFAYGAHFKRTPLTGNLLVSTVTGLAFVYGGMAVGRVKESLFPALFSFCFHFGREVLKDIQDMEGDARDAARTFPLAFGVPASVALIILTFIVLMVLTALPYVFGRYGGWYFALVAVGIYPVLIYVMARIRKYPPPEELGFLSNLLKGDMLIGLLALYLR